MITFFSCIKPPCSCDFIERLSIDVKIVDNSGNDLVSGPSPIYKIDSIQILNRLNDFTINNASVNPSYYKANSIAFNFYIPATKSYIYYRRGVAQDSLEISWITKTGKCCGGPTDYLAVGSVKFNDKIITPQNGVYYFSK